MTSGRWPLSEGSLICVWQLTVCINRISFRLDRKTVFQGACSESYRPTSWKDIYLSLPLHGKCARELKKVSLDKSIPLEVFQHTIHALISCKHLHLERMISSLNFFLCQKTLALFFVRFLFLGAYAIHLVDSDFWRQDSSLRKVEGTLPSCTCKSVLFNSSSNTCWFYIMTWHRLFVCCSLTQKNPVIMHVTKFRWNEPRDPIRGILRNDSFLGASIELNKGLYGKMFLRSNINFFLTLQQFFF